MGSNVPVRNDLNKTTTSSILEGKVYVSMEFRREITKTALREVYSSFLGRWVKNLTLGRLIEPTGLDGKDKMTAVRSL